MTILIRGMEMPENCDDCFLGDFYCEKCQHIDGYKMAGSRPFDCPLIEVPTPHGRLGDLDELIKHDHQYYEYLSDEFYVLVRDIENAPTVIEAEEGK